MHVFKDNYPYKVANPLGVGRTPLLYFCHEVDAV